MSNKSFFYFHSYSSNNNKKEREGEEKRDNAGRCGDHFIMIILIFSSSSSFSFFPCFLFLLFFSQNNNMAVCLSSSFIPLCFLSIIIGKEDIIAIKKVMLITHILFSLFFVSYFILLLMLLLHEINKYKQLVHPRRDWELVKDDIMLQCLRLKFDQNLHCKNVLLSTHDAILVEHTLRDGYIYIGVKVMVVAIINLANY